MVIVSVWDEKVLEMDSDDRCTTMWMYWMTMNYKLKNSWNGKFYIMHSLQ